MGWSFKKGNNTDMNGKDEHLNATINASKAGLLHDVKPRVNGQPPIVR